MLSIGCLWYFGGLGNSSVAHQCVLQWVGGLVVLTMMRKSRSKKLSCNESEHRSVLVNSNCQRHAIVSPGFDLSHLGPSETLLGLPGVEPETWYCIPSLCSTTRLWLLSIVIRPSAWIGSRFPWFPQSLVFHIFSHLRTAWRCQGFKPGPFGMPSTGSLLLSYGSPLDEFLTSNTVPGWCWNDLKLSEGHM